VIDLSRFDTQALQEAADRWAPGTRIEADGGDGVMHGEVVNASEYASVCDGVRLGSAFSTLGKVFTAVRWDSGGVGSCNPSDLREEPVEEPTFPENVTIEEVQDGSTILAVGYNGVVYVVYNVQDNKVPEGIDFVRGEYRCVVSQDGEPNQLAHLRMPIGLFPSSEYLFVTLSKP
jgi:hypothetical protein